MNTLKSIVTETPGLLIPFGFVVGVVMFSWAKVLL